MAELSFVDVSVRYGHGRNELVAVDDVSLEVPRGTVVGLVGESGSGKSTLARAAVGLAPVSAGRVLLDGVEVGSLGRRRPVQMVFQDATSALDPRLPIGRTIAEALPRRRRADRSGARARVGELLELVGLDADRAGAYPGALSGGQRQRVGVARALAAEPAYLLADEITSALDVSVQGALLNLVRSLQKEMGFGMLFISHNLAVVRYVSDRVAVMYLGRIAEQGPADAVLSAPSRPYTRSLVEAVPSFGDRQALAVAVPTLDVEPPEPQDPPPGCRFHTRCPRGPAVEPDRTICCSVVPPLLAVGTDRTAACHFVDAVRSA